MTSWTDHSWRSRDGLALHARSYGEANDKLPVICIPGLTRNARDFEEVAPWIAGLGRRVVAVDLRGRGASERARDPKTYNPRIYAHDMVQLLTSLGAAKAIFVGTSLGGLVMLSLAMTRPNVIAGGVINDVGPEVGKAGLARIKSYAGKTAAVESWADAVAYAKGVNAVAFPDMLEQEWIAVAHRLFRDEVGRPVLDYDPQIFRPANPVATWLAQPLLWLAFKRLGRAGPLLVVRGELSDILEAKTVARMERVAPGMKAVSVARVGHAPTLSESEVKLAFSALFARAP